MQAPQPGALGASAARDKLYRKARSIFSPPDVTEGDFTALAENVFRVALGQTQRRRRRARLYATKSARRRPPR